LILFHEIAGLEINCTLPRKANRRGTKQFVQKSIYKQGNNNERTD
jgi:hypothetical protein